VFALTGIFSFPVVDAVPMTFFVNSSDDVEDVDGCEILPDHCSLREAISAANSNSGFDTITFAVPGAPYNILPDSQLPFLSSPAVITAGILQVVINGQNAGLLVDGLQITGGTTVRGLVINNFDANGINIVGSNNLIVGNKIGTNAAGTIAMPNGNNGGSPFKLHGIQISGSSNTIGGTDPADRNIISGNFGAGVAVIQSSDDVIHGNYIGTDISGNNDLGNFFGVTIVDSPNTLVGGTMAGARNIISGNDGLGIQMFTVAAAASSTAEETNTESYETMTSDTTFSSVATNIYDQKYDEIQFSPKTQQVNVHQQIISNDNIGSSELTIQEIQVSASFIGTGSNIEGNYIGTNVAGTGDLGNSQGGIQITGVANTMIGGSFAARNIISGNGDSGFTLGSGIAIFDNGATGNVIQNNNIGTDVTGTAALGNTNNGIQIQSGQGNTIGGTLAGQGNTISANAGQGILIGDPFIDDSSGNIVQRNIIGADISGVVDLGNGGSGIAIQNGPDNIIGGTTSAARNFISGNGVDGITIVSPGSTRNMIQGNYIGTDLSGTVSLGNSQSGVRIIDSRNNTIGGTISGAGNLLSGNLNSGVLIINSQEPTLFAFNNTVQGNFIGTDLTGTSAIGNTEHGVLIVSSPLNKIGGEAAGARNIISGNLQNGILIAGNAGPNAFNNTITGNHIGTRETGFADLGNGFAGIHIENVPNNIVGGTTEQARNLISGKPVLETHFRAFSLVHLQTL